jgi:hypothetical protein
MRQRPVRPPARASATTCAEPGWLLRHDLHRNVPTKPFSGMQRIHLGMRLIECERRQASRRRCGRGGTSARLPPRKPQAAPAGSRDAMASGSLSGARGAGRRWRRGVLRRPGGGRRGGRGQADGRARVAVAASGPGARAGRAGARAAEHVRADQGPGRHDYHHLGRARCPPGSAPRPSTLFRRPAWAANGPGTRPRTPGHYRASTPRRLSALRRPSSSRQAPAPRQAPALTGQPARPRAAEGPCAAATSWIPARAS